MDKKQPKKVLVVGNNIPILSGLQKSLIEPHIGKSTIAMHELERGITIETVPPFIHPEILLPRPNRDGNTYPFGKGINLNLHMITDCDGDRVPIVGIRKLSDIKREGGDYFRGFELVSHIENHKGDSVTLIRDMGEAVDVEDCCAMFEDGRPGDRVYKPENQKDKNKRNWNHQKRKKF